MNPKLFILTLLCPVAMLGAPAGAAILSIEFAGGSNEVTVAPNGTVQVDVVWTMQTTDTAKSLLSNMDLRFNASAGPDPNGPEHLTRFIVESASTTTTGWVVYPHSGVGHYFNDADFFLSAGHAQGDLGVVGNGTEFRQVVLSFVLRKTDFAPGDTYVTIRHDWPNDVLPAAYNDEFDWQHQWQGVITGPNQFKMGQGNPGDAGMQFPYHGYESFQPITIHSIPEPSALCVLVLGALTSVRPRKGCGVSA